MGLEDVKCFLLDMDGTIYLGDKLINGANEFLNYIVESGRKFIFLTNNSSKDKSVYREKLLKLGIVVSEDSIFTSGEATTIFLNKLKPNAEIFLLGTSTLRKEFELAGFILDNYVSHIPDYVVLGFDTTLTYEKVWRACDYIRSGAKFIATHPDINCPLEEGKFMPDAGAIIKMIESATGVSPEIIGKPSNNMIDAVIEKYKLKKCDLAIVGDRLYTDIKTGENAGITAILVLSGETDLKMYEESNIRADYVFDSVKNIIYEKEIILKK